MLKKVMLAASCALALSTVAASADVVCNEEGDCWHVKERHAYKPEFKLQVHPDSWKWEGDKHRWREHDGRGYWRNGVWIEF